jgi:hypothetical protein
VSTFVDTMLVRLSAPGGLLEVIFPDGDAARARIKALLAEVYDLQFATVHDVLAVDVLSVECQRPVFATVRRTGNWLQSLPSTARTDFSVEGNGDRPQWIDLLAETAVTVVLASEPAGAESFSLKDVGEFSTLAEFQAKVPELDLDAFMARHGLSTVDELRAAFRYQAGEVRLKPVPPFDPADPANQQTLRLTIAILVRDTVDLAGALRDVRLITVVQPGFPRQVAAGETRSPHAPLLVLPAGATGGLGLTPEQITEFLAGQRVLAVFEQP